MSHSINVTLTNGQVITIAVKKNVKLVEAIIFQIDEVIKKLRKSITTAVDTYCWVKADYMVGSHVEGTITAI